MTLIKKQPARYMVFYSIFGAANIFILWYYLSDTILAFTTSQQFPISSFERFPLTYLIFPAEVFSFLFGLYFVYLLVTNKPKQSQTSLQEWQKGNKDAVAILLPVYNEPKDIVDRTIRACKKISWHMPVHIYLLDDSTESESQKEMSVLGKQHGCKIIRRNDRKGYKAGNINNAIANHVTENYVLILDSDQAPSPNLLEETMPYFSDAQVGFVQLPQYYINDGTPLERATKIGANIFFQTQCQSKALDGALPFCGTNAIIRTAVFRQVKGFSYYTATEDIELGLRINQAGYKGVYVPKILVYGYGPVDFSAYSSQQYRWANGNLAILREHFFKLLKGDFSLRYQIHTLYTLGWWLIGFVTLAFILVPILSLLFDLGTHHSWLPTSLVIALYFNVAMGIMLVYVSLRKRVDGEKVRIQDALLQYSLITNSMFIYAHAALSVLFKRYIGFVRTDKKGTLSGWWHIKWNLLLALVCYTLSMYALYQASLASDIVTLRTYLPISVWLLFYAMVLTSSILFVGTVGPTFAKDNAHVHLHTGVPTEHQRRHSTIVGASVNASYMSKSCERKNSGADATGVAPYGVSHRAKSADFERLPPIPYPSKH